MSLTKAADECGNRSMNERIADLGLDRDEVMRIAQDRASYLLKSSGLLYNKHTFQMFTLASLDGILIGNTAGKEPHAQA